jgi:hypothetical protein
VTNSFSSIRRKTKQKHKRKKTHHNYMFACTKGICFPLRHKNPNFPFANVIVTYIHYEFIMRAQSRWYRLKMTATASSAC